MDKNLNIVVVCGGLSTEREVSLRSGKSIYEALLRQGYLKVQYLDFKGDVTDIIKLNPEFVFLGLHGKGGEDGCIQGFLELSNIPYSGPGVTSSAICMDKIQTKRILENAGVPTAKFLAFRKDECENIEFVEKRLLKEIGLPMVLKSPCQGSSIGVVMVKRPEEIKAAIDEVFKYGDHLLAEEFLSGVEITLPILGNTELLALPIIEITSEREFYDYTSKYTSGLCHHIIPANIDKTAEREAVERGKKAYKVLDCCGLSRIDFIVDKTRGPLVIEVNTLPGMTDMSLFPDAARYVGMSYEELVEKILEYGMTAKRELQR